MTREQRFHFLQSAGHVVPRYHPLFLTLAGTGLRLGEALALQWGDVDVYAREIRVAAPKSGYGRTVDLPRCSPGSYCNKG